jgi:hypothetical protein
VPGRGIAVILGEICESQVRAASALDLASIHLARAAVALYPGEDAFAATRSESEEVTDREFLLDRIATHRLRATEMRRTASLAIDDLLRLLDVAPDLELATDDTLARSLAGYVQAITAAGDECVVLAADLDEHEGSVGGPALEDVSVAIRFLNGEAAAFEAFIEDSAPDD